MHVGGPPGTRGAFSLYVPEYYDAASACPLVVALHGGSGNGGAFLWSWLREARTPRLRRDRADGHRLDLVADGARRSTGPASTAWSSMSRPPVEHRSGPPAADRHERRRHLHLRAGPARRLPLHPSGADRRGLPSHADDLRRSRSRARSARPYRARRPGLDVPARAGAERRADPGAGRRRRGLSRDRRSVAHLSARREWPDPRLVPGETRRDHHRKRRQGPLRRAARHPDAGGALPAHSRATWATPRPGHFRCSTGS